MKTLTITLADCWDHCLDDVSPDVEPNAIRAAVATVSPDAEVTIRERRDWPMRFADFAGPWLPGESEAVLAAIREARAAL